MSEMSEYGQGHAAGEIAARLADHDEHLAKINGSIDRFTAEMHALVMAVQRLSDQAVARDATVVTTAKALKDADQARRDTEDRHWSPMAKVITVVAALAAVAEAALLFASRGR